MVIHSIRLFCHIAVRDSVRYNEYIVKVDMTNLSKINHRTTMHHTIIALFDSAHGTVKVDEVVEYRTAPDGRRIAEFKASDGHKYIAHLENLFLRNAMNLKVLSL